MGEGECIIRSPYLLERSNQTNKDRAINSIIYFFYVYLKPIIRILVSIIFVILGIMVLYGEAAILIGMDDSIVNKVIETLSFRDKTVSFIKSNFICLIPLSYITVTSNYGLFKLKITGIYGLHKNQ